jgi:H+/Cl- antiporter ClcA
VGATCGVPFMGLALGTVGPDVQVQGAVCDAIRQLLQEDVQVDMNVRFRYLAGVHV